MSLLRLPARWRTAAARLRDTAVAAFSALHARWPGEGVPPSDGAPLRFDLFTAAEMRLHGLRLAALHRLAPRRGADGLLMRLADNERTLARVCTLLASRSGTEQRLTPAGEWLLDNFHLIDEEMRNARRLLPPGYSRELPQLLAATRPSHPRVYTLALQAVVHTDGRLDRGALGAFLEAYQTQQPLRLGELWAVPIMLRLALIENLRRVAVRVADSLVERETAGRWADQMVEAAAHAPRDLILVVADMARSDPVLTEPFVAELSRRLHGRGNALALPLNWVEQRLAEQGVTIDAMQRTEAQAQAAAQVSVSNSISGLRLLASTDWRGFVESQSAVDRCLRADPAGVYARMDFASRDALRHAVERLARRSGADEAAVAQAALALASQAPALPQSHVGWWLHDAGAPVLAHAVGLADTPARRLQAALARHRLALYAGAIVATSVAGTAALLLAAGPGLGAWPALAAVLAGSLVASQGAVALVNALAMRLTSPRPLPRLDFSAGIPEAHRTLVVVPTMLSSPACIAPLAEALEVRHLANRDAQLHFALLTDFADAPQERMPGDEALLVQAAQAVRALNERHPGAPFLLLHRPRRWNPSEGVWMGHERKRGKLEALNRLLREGPPGDFSLLEGDIAWLSAVRYVITLDTDTLLPRETAAAFIATLAHPLNRPRIGGSDDAPRVVAGHAILQPRVGSALTPDGSAGGLTGYARLFGGDPGIDPYSGAISDVYQDLFGEGSFVGKGIYDVDAVHRVLHGRLPDDRILSHDLLEGGYARSALLSDVELSEQPPPHYAADAKRRHRWMRGDWQIAAWTLARVPLPAAADAGAPRRGLNPLTPLSRLKIFDNLRRSLVAPAMLVLLLAGWLAWPQPGLWTAAVLVVLLTPALLALAGDLLKPPGDAGLRAQLALALAAARLHLSQAAYALVVLPHAAQSSADAVLRTLWRLHVSRRRLLEWQPSAVAGRPGGRLAGLAGLIATAALLAAGPLLALATAAALLVWRPEGLAVAGPVLLLWLLSPWIVWRIDQPVARRTAALDAADRPALRLLARRTWAFFEAHVGAEDNHLPPDNVQWNPEQRVAHRTSPTNIGLSLLSTLAAHDFGWIGDAGLITRTAATLDTLQRMERYRGHWLNWYDTRTLQPLRPAYVSSVDSGNLAGHLLTLRAGLLALARTAPDPWRLVQGLDDPLRLLQAALADEPGATGATGATAAPFATAWAALAAPGLQHGAPPAAALAALDEAAQALVAAGLPGEAAMWAAALQQQCAAAHAALQPLAERAAVLQRLADVAGTLAEMDFGFLYDPQCEQLAIGWNVDEARLDAGRYDLLASEARLAVFVAIASGQLPQRAWFALGRRLALLGGHGVLLSWSGSMFEYLMPLLVMPGYDDSLMAETMRGAVARQVQYGRQRGVPWGISESGYHATDAQLNYQYRAFGVPDMALRRGLAADLVVAPYATVLALMVAPREAARNLRRLAAEGMAMRYGLYEAVDCTPARLPPGESRVIVRSCMVHHQGMSLLALASVLLGQPMQRRFTADPALQATLLLLQERVARAQPHPPPQAERPELHSGDAEAAPTAREFNTPQTLHPEVQLLSNGRYHVMLTVAGAGSSRWGETALTRWREDGTTDAWGAFCYLRDLETGHFWSTTPQPVPRVPDRFEAVFHDGRAEFRRRDEDIEARTEVVVSPEDDFELRRLRLCNRGTRRRTLELTTCAEVVLAPQAADAAHPAFGKLFVQTEWLQQPPALVCTRRPRSAEERPPSMFHLVVVHGSAGGEVSHETDRARFIGRGRSLQWPAALVGRGPLSGTVGPVLDPMVAIRHQLVIEPGQTVVVDIAYGAADSREACIALAAKVTDRRLADRVFELAWTHSQVLLRQLDTSQASADTYARLAGIVIHAQPTLRADAAVLLQNRRGQSGLWGYGISGDLPIVLLQIADTANLDLVRRLVQAHAWWRMKGLVVDLVIWNEERDVYRQQLHEAIVGLIAGRADALPMERPGGIFVRHAAQIAEEDRVLLQAVARVRLSDRRGTLEQQVHSGPPPERRMPRLVPRRVPEPAGPGVAVPTDLRHFNGHGGFSADGRAYVVVTQGQRRPPAPWVNVIANPRFGTVVSEAGNAYTWCENAHALRLTPWHNDPVTDSGGEAFYLRDEDSGEVWSPTALPPPLAAGDEAQAQAAASATYLARHGFGHSVFEHRRGGVHSTLTVFVALEDAVKYSCLLLRNDGPRPRRLSVTAYVEWVLGDQREKTAPHVATALSPEHGALCARNRHGSDFGDWVAFLDVDPAELAGGSVTGDRDEFIGRNGTLARPAALRRERLSGRTGPGLDPCGAIQVQIELAPGQSHEVVFRLGMGRSDDEAERLVRSHRGPARAAATLEAVHAHWHALLGAVQVHTPAPTLDLLVNGWLVYQTVACRLWARSGYYQSGGAWGFRDQLQDAMALVHTRPALLREQLLRCAERQFVQGDVQHWWHPPAGRGVRTRISDDLLWLPLALCRYVGATHDTGVLTEPVGFLDGPPVLAPDESRYDLPQRAAETAPLFEHARRAVQRALVFGAHGLPLMGSGDWNDGMNRVGEQGRGESVWLGFFLCEVLRDFAPLARRHGDADFAVRCDSERTALAMRLESAGWDGDWYRRAYFDDGTPLGSASNVECRIDAIAQSWAVLSGVAAPARAQMAMDAVQAQLVRPDAGLVQLLAPPFDRHGPDPGYIAGYLPGVRENGGQYTHAAIWAAMAFAAQGDAVRAWGVVDLINPVHHGNSAAAVAVYKAEPYVMAADVYGQPPHAGRGGWSWYTGSAAWMYRLALESLLGLSLQVDAAGARLLLRPCLPADWPGCSIDYRWRRSLYRITITRGPITGLQVDGQRLDGDVVPLVDDGATHAVALMLVLVLA